MAGLAFRRSDSVQKTEVILKLVNATAARSSLCSLNGARSSTGAPRRFCMQAAWIESLLLLPNRGG